MAIQIGDQFPNVSTKRLGESGMEDLNVADYLKGKKVVMFATPGAFTPACAQKHLPGYIAKSEEIRSTGVDEIICLSVNDPFVMKHWGETAGTEGKVTMLPDGNAQIIDALGLSMDGSGAGLGKRAQRFSMVIENGVVKDLQIESKGSDVTVSSAETCAVNLSKGAAAA